MKDKQMIDYDRLYFSMVYGRGIYQWDGEMVQDPLPRMIRGEGGSPLLINVQTGEKFYAKKFNMSTFECDRYKKMILTPISSSLGLWPVDMVALSGVQQANLGLYLKQEYRDVSSGVSKWQGDGALLFPYGGYPELTIGERFFPSEDNNGWRSKRIREMAISLVRAIDLMNWRGYAFLDMHFSRLFFKDDGLVYLDFSNLIYSLDDLPPHGSSDACSPRRDEYPLEFAEPAYVQGKISSFDVRTQNYNLAAMLFYLFFNRYAYDGQLTEYMPDDSIVNHYNKLEKFFEAPVFVFDESDRANALDPNDKNDSKVIELWNSLPVELREMFTTALVQSNAERTAGEGSPAPSDWLKAFSKLGWV